MNVKTLVGAGLAAIVGLGVLLLGTGERAVGVSQSAAQTPGTCEALDTREQKLQCIAIAECFGTDYKSDWAARDSCAEGATTCTAYNERGKMIIVNCDEGTVQ